jgi:hypothetical protein
LRTSSARRTTPAPRPGPLVALLGQGEGPVGLVPAGGVGGEEEVLAPPPPPVRPLHGGADPGDQLLAVRVAARLDGQRRLLGQAADPDGAADQVRARPGRGVRPPELGRGHPQEMDLGRSRRGGASGQQVGRPVEPRALPRPRQAVHHEGVEPGLQVRAVLAADQLVPGRDELLIRPGEQLVEGLPVRVGRRDDLAAAPFMTSVRGASRRASSGREASRIRPSRPRRMGLQGSPAGPPPGIPRRGAGRGGSGRP